MSGVGDVGHHVGAGYGVDIVLHCIHRPELVVGAHEEHLGLRQLSAVAVGVHHFHQCLALRIRHVLGETQVHIILDLLAVFAVHHLLVCHVHRHVQYVDDHRCDGFDARVARGGGEPGGPSALRDTVYDEVRHSPSLLSARVHQLLHGVHGADGCLRHGEKQGPCVVARLLKLVVGVGDEHVLDLSPEERLPGHLPYDGCHCLAVVRHLSDGLYGAVVPVVVSYLAGLLVLSASRQVEQCLAVLHPSRDDDHHLVHPRYAAPRLRTQQQAIGRDVGYLCAVYYGPLETRVAVVDIVAERGLGCRGMETGVSRDAGSCEKQEY